MDGWVTIGTKLDSKQLESDLKNAEKRLQQFEKESERLTTTKTKVEVDLQAYNQQKKAIEESTNEMLKFAETEEQVNNVLYMEENQLNTLNQQYSEQFKKIEEINQKLQENAHNQGLIKNQIQETNKQLQQSNNLSDIKKGIDGIGNSVQNVTKKIGRWALAVFGVRSAYMFVRQAMSTLSQYDEQMATNVEYIRYLLASSLKPVIEGIIQLAYQLLTYINYISQAWFGVNLFANASTEAFEKQNKALSGSVKKAKELEKTIAGFDEMNVIQENGDVSSGGGGGGATLPSFPKMEDVEIPGWIKWIADNGDKVVGILIGLATAITLVKLGVDGFLALGIGVIIAGIVMLVQDIIDFINDPSWDNFADILIDLAVILAGVAIAMLAVNAANPVAWIVLAIAAIVALVALIIKYWDEISAWLLGLALWIYDHVIKPVVDFFVGLWDAIKNGVVAAWNFIVGIVVGVATWIYQHIIKPVADFFVGLWDGIVNGVKSAIDFIKNIFNSVVNFFKNIISTIVGLFKTIGTKVGNAISSAFKAVINAVLAAIEGILNFPIKAINALISAINLIPGINLSKLKTFKLPRLAKGGIVNMPGSGVMVGSAIAGERGQEGVIPLTDSQQMELLGQSIGKYVTINATIPVYAYNRQVDRQIRKIQAEDNFAYNK